MLAAVGRCAGIALLYVASLYVWGNAGLRQDPQTVKKRMVSVLGASGLSCLPLAYACAGEHYTGPPLLQLLGLRAAGLLQAVLLPVVLTLVLYSGPLLYWAITPAARSGKGIKAIGTIHGLRDFVVAPVAEEFVFRACMAPLLWLQGVSHAALVLSTPLFFGAAHLHHLYELMRHSRASGRTALLVVGVQFTYTTIFGWYATHMFLRTGHLLSPVLAHALCNYLGLPPFTAMARSRHGPLLLAATAAGVCGFVLLLPRLLDERLYANKTYAETWSSLQARQLATP